eukprot:NODE_425_length_852_cov_392.177931_g416_i0.p1 GENE.NODE_425_length_852_cov_392.177931_g416_i0~~NODE_425_length_852_cov_392.177931_g416_i0.p1  ORF type:complete len:193 (-),score=41.41 NODE_425_length_852_cov_392.177931_g416_i0:219-797(-)
MHPGAMGARAAAMNGGRNRAQKRKKELSLQMDKLFQKYDANHSRNLNKEELTDLLTELNDGDPPTPNEVQWVLYSADKSDGSLNNRVDRHEIEEGIKAWKAFKEHKPEIESIFKKYDTDNTGKLEAPELKKVLTDLNDGDAPDDREVDWVLRMADRADGMANGAVDKTELQAAISLWYAHHDGKHHHCCVVM